MSPSHESSRFLLPKGKYGHNIPDQSFRTKADRKAALIPPRDLDMARRPAQTCPRRPFGTNRCFFSSVTLDSL